MLSRIRDLERSKRSAYVDPPQFYDFFMNRVVVQFKPRFDDMERTEDFELTLSKKMSYEAVS